MGKGLSLPVVLVLLLAACTGLFPNRSTGDLQLELKPPSFSVAQGQSQTITLTLTPQNGFTGTVTLTLERQDGSPAPQGLTLSPTSLNVADPNPVAQDLTVAVAQNVQPGTYALRVKATSGNLTRTANLSLTVQAPPPAPDFTISLDPPSLTVQQGASGSATLTLTPQNGFSGNVSLTLVNAPSGLTLSPGSVNVPGLGTVTQTLTLAASTFSPIGNHTVKIRATGNGISHEANLSLTVTQAPAGDFTLTLESPSLTVTQGGRAYVRLAVNGSYAGSISLSLVDGNKNPFPGVALSPTSTPVPSAPMLELAASPSLAPGTYNLFVQGTGGNLTREAPLTLTVASATPPPDFTLSVNPSDLTLQQGKSGTAILTLYSQNFVGNVNLSHNAPSGIALAFQSPWSIPGSGTHSQQVTVSIAGSVTPGTYPITVTATSGSLSKTVNLTLTVTASPPPGDFSISLNPTSLSIPQGGSSTATLTLTPQGGFTGQVDLALEQQNGSPAPNGITLSPSSFNVTGTNPMTQTLTIGVAQGMATGSYSLRVKATSGGLTKTTNLTLTVTVPPDFSLSLNPASLTVQQGGIATTQLTLTPQNGFTGTVNLSVSGAPSGVQVSFQQNPWNINGTQTQTVTVSTSSATPPGNYVLTMTATGGNLSKTASLNLAVSSSSSPNLRIAKAEWGQTVLKEGLRLVAGKPALLRVHLLASPSPISLSNALVGAVYQGSTFQGNLTFTCPNPIPTATDPGNLATTCTATLPPGWVAPGLRVELKADPQDQVAESDEADNLLSLAPSVGTGTVLHLTVVPVIHQGQQAQIPGFSQTLWRIWPLKEISPSTRAPYTFNSNLSPGDGNAWAQLLDELRILRQTDGSGRYYYGFVKVSYTSGIAGIGYVGYPVAVGWDYAQSGPAVMAHELGHNFNREHAPCGTSGDANYPYPGGKIGTWGYDLANGSLKDPSQHYDLMSYCGPQWISDYTYEGAQSFLETSPPKPLSLPEEGLLFSGRIGNGGVVLNPPLRVAAWPEGEASPHRLQAKTASGEVREAPVLVLKDSEGILHFQARLPLEAYSWVGLYLGNQLLKETSPPLLPQAEPQVELREEGGFLWARVQGYPYFSLFHLTPDGTRTALGLWHQAGEVRFALASLPPGGEFEVQLSDGLNVRILRFPR